MVLGWAPVSAGGSGGSGGALPPMGGSGGALPPWGGLPSACAPPPPSPPGSGPPSVMAAGPISPWLGSGDASSAGHPSIKLATAAQKTTHVGCLVIMPPPLNDGRMPHLSA